MPEFPFPGLNLALTTPFDSEGQVAFDSLPGHIERYLAAGVESFVLSSGTGMHVYLSRAESDRLVVQAARLIDGRARIIVQASALLAEDVIERTRHAAGCGAGAVMVLPPFFEGPTADDDILRFYEEIGAGGLPVIGYNVPQAVGAGIVPDLLRRLAELPHFLTVKDSSGDLAAGAALIRTGLPVMNGGDPLMIFATFAGAAGMIWGGANFAPRSCLAMLRAASQGDWDRAREIWRALEPAMALIWQGDYVQSVYAAAEMAGLGAGAPRRPLSRLSPARHAALEPVIVDLARFEAGLETG
ncbi:dihydrodipicolinate synthase family protein [Sinirhodobacter populi]|uniref:Dihydrodipicolinate synthase family protein n=1 Tax=Paenirhodobacter populi TaxID=2306993 RepID=A0A443K2H8_9RHOB|nr:dihydrodipicolinate synthase family protein [Sinirhodobacter populi]RWR26964.1 dihydrodipicolinate synthase family protein [Sinirhodobacter populi]